MGKLANRACMSVAAAPGTGAISLGTAVVGYLSFAAAGIINGDVVSYTAESNYSNGRPSVFEFGVGTYSSTGPTLTRTIVSGGSSGTSPVNLAADAQVFVTPLAADIPGPCWDVEIEDQRPSGTGAGAASVGTWFTRAFNTVVRNTVGATLSGNQLTLPQGTWEIWWEATGYRTLGHQSRLYDATSAAVVKLGGTEVMNNATVQSRSSGTAEVPFSTARTFRIESWFYNNNGDANGCGVDISSGSVNVFSRLRARRFKG